MMNSSCSLSTISQLSNSSVPHTLSSPTLNQVDPKALKPHPRNSSIYGDDEDVTELIEMIRASGWIKPLVITPVYAIVSGHRRWKAALELGIESIPVEVREFPDELAELEALLLENASRFKTTEQKVREAQAWKVVETSKARRRQIELAGSRPRTQKTSDLQPNLAEGHEKGQTRDKVAARVGLRRTTYEKAANVVRAIDFETSQGNLEHAAALRKILNEQSVDAAVQLLKKPYDERHQILSLISGSKAKNTKEAIALIQQSQDSAQRPSYHYVALDSPQQLRSCWNCQHRGESIENHSFYCNRLGTLSLLDKGASQRGAECDLWCNQWREAENKAAHNTQPTNYTLTLSFSGHLRPLIEDAARIAGMSVVDWASYHLFKAATGIATETHQESGTVNVRFTEKPSGGGQD